MKTKRLLCVVIGLVLLLSATLLTACDPSRPIAIKPKKGITSETLHVSKVENLADDFVFGMDASSVLSLEKSGVKYFDFDGNEQDVFKILADNGINTIRVRVWNDPFDSNGNGYGGGNCNIDTAVEIGKRANAFGMNLMVDFHYSDFWADPSKQMAPKAWSSMNVGEKRKALYQYTQESLQKLKQAGVRVSMVQIGNETTKAFCGEDNWRNIANLMKEGCAAVRKVLPNAKIVVHFTNPEEYSNYLDYASQLNKYEVDYDVFASSYYPYWHGTLENLTALLSEIAETYDKKVMVAETSYAYTAEDTDFFGNTIVDGGGDTKNYPFTIQGQANCVRDVVNAVANATNGIGVCYWEGTWISVGGSSWEENSALWEQYGSGWATSYAGSYDPGDAGKYYGGTAVDNQAFFDKNGRALESLKVFGLVREGNTVSNKADALADVTIICDLNGTLNLPETVNAVMLDDSKVPVPVVWDITQEKINEMYNGGVKKYTITGIADGMTVHCYVSMVEYNYITNYSFEEDANGSKTPVGWTVKSNVATKQLYVEEKETDSLTGKNHMHFYSDSANGVDFAMEQSLTNLQAGTYKYSISIMGGDCGTTEIFAYVKINGVIVATAPMKITVYNEWDTAWIENIVYNGTDDVVVGIHVKCAAAGAWGKIDDALFNSVK
ncbi:MAG: glycosyl hydrolase 53 family protein [Candidatus Fimimonas sp.]